MNTLERSGRGAGPAGQKAGRVGRVVRWAGRLYVGLACLNAIGIVVQLCIGRVALAVSTAAYSIAFLCIGGVAIVASRVDWPAFTSPEMVRSRELSKAAFRHSRLRWMVALLGLVQVAAMVFILYLLVRHR